jgi:hypothetical protein
MHILQKHPYALAALFTLSLCLSACKDSQPPAPVKAPVAAAPVATVVHTREQAMAALMALPELQAWAAYVDKASEGKSHGTVIEYGATPKEINGKYYFQMSFVENGPENLHRWEDFLVEQDGSTILVEDDTSDKVRTLEQWRKEKKPMARIKKPSN